MDLDFSVRAQWTGVGQDGEGVMGIGPDQFRYSAPATMGGKGVGASPEDLLLAAVTACYSGTFMRVLRHAGLAVESVGVTTEGVVREFPTNAKFAAITVNPTIQGGDFTRQKDYEEAAQEARDRCFIGRTVRDYLDYRVGVVSLQ